jgi:hypothetical protein
MLAMQLPAALATPQRLLVAYATHEHGLALSRKQRHLRASWDEMQLDYPRWSLSCLLVAGMPAGNVSEHAAYEQPATFRHPAGHACADLHLPIPSDGRRRGHVVHRMLRFLGEARGATVRFDFVLKAELSTLVCFNMLTDLLDAAALRYGRADRIYMGELQTCTRVEHDGLARRGDETRDEAFLDDVLRRKDAVCYPPYMQGFGYVLSGQLVRRPCCTQRALRRHASTPLHTGHAPARGRTHARPCRRSAPLGRSSA